jgi:hypothetical protein
MGVKLGLSHEGNIWEQGAEKNIGPNSDKVAGGWRRLHNEELRNL